MLALTLSISLASCGEAPCTDHVDADQNGKCDNCNANVEPQGGGEGNGGQTGEGLVLVTGSKTGFAVVAADSLTNKSEGYVNDFIKNLNRYYLDDQALKLNYDAPGFDDVVEIIFGSPKNRGDAFKKDEHYLGYKGFSIEVIGNKLFVLAGGDKGYQDAIKYLEDTLFNLDGYENVIDELVIPADTKYESIPTDYDTTEFTINNTSVSEFVITYTADAKIAKTSAIILQDTIYKQTGIWVPYVAMSKVTDDQKVIYVEFTKGDTERRTDNGFALYVKGGDLHIECEFENKFEEMIYSFIDSKLSSAKVKISASYTYSKDVRNIYYKDYGAVGDGITDDFFALKACHDYANQWGHTVNADPNAVYYIGKENGTQSITIKTDTYWNCCEFIFDDRYIDKPGQSNAYQASIFKITPDAPSYSLTGSKLPVTSVLSGATSIGDWKPSTKVMVTLTDNTKRHYIRYGSNQNNGTAQVEIVIVNPDGSIDPDTPIQWDYVNLSKMTVQPIDDTPITVSGGTKGQVDDYAAMGIFDSYHNIGRTTMYTYFNTAPSEYNYHGRNIAITRSNVTIKNLEHVLYDQETETSAPYNGWITVNSCSDVVVEGMIVQMQKGFATIGAQGTSVGMGSYEFSAGYANRLTWRHCRISNFFEEDGRVTYDGNMGTNYCKNLMFDNVVNHSFDAHCGLYNGTIKDSTIEHLNFIGGGTIKYENVTVYTDGASAAMTYRSDYGSIWNGDVIIDGLTLKTSKAAPNLSVIGVTYTNHFFGYTCYLPRTVSVNNAKIIRYSFKMENGIRIETEVAQNHVPLHLYYALEKYTSVDISDPEANMSAYKNDYIKCDCEAVYKKAYPDDPTKWKTFNDTDGDGRCNNDLNPLDSYSVWCWGFENTPDKTINANPYIPTQEVTVTNCGNLEFIVPPTPQFKDTVVYIDGVLQKKKS